MAKLYYEAIIFMVFTNLFLQNVHGKDCEEIKEELESDGNGGEHLLCSNKGKPECSTIKISNIDEESNDSKIEVVLGTYQYIGEWKDVGSPIYRKDKEDSRDTDGPFYLYYGSKQWIVSDKSIGATKDHVLHSANHCKVDDYEDCSGKWKLFKHSKYHEIKIECEDTGVSTGAIVGILIAILVIIAIIVLVVIVLRKRRQHRETIGMTVGSQL